MNINQDHHIDLPIRNNLTPIYILSLLIVILMTVASVAGLFYPVFIYPTEVLYQAFFPNDVINLFVGLPIILGSMWLAQRGKLIGLLCWPGTLVYVFYNYMAYVFAVPLNRVFLLYLALVVMSVYTLIGLVASIDGKAVQQRLTGAVPEKFAGSVLAGLGFLFLLRVIGVIVNSLIGGSPVTEADLAVNISDSFISPALVAGGILLWQCKAFGYVAGLGLLFQTSMLFIGLIIFLLLQPLISTAPFKIFDVIVVFTMGLICFVPFVLFIRGAAAISGSVQGSIDET